MYAQHVAPKMGARARPDHEYAAHLHEPNHLLFYHYALYSPNMRYYQATRGRRVFSYHNITPSLYFRGWDREQELLCDVGRRILPSLADCDLAIGDSDYNRQELVQSGFARERTAVMPLFMRKELFEDPPAELPLPDQLRSEGDINFLSVGRIVPNKAIEDIIRVFYTYHRGINPRSHLYLVGPRYLPAYDAKLDDLVETLGLQTSVTFAGLVLPPKLQAYYQAADIYVQASYHEGFCVPLLEAMQFGVPILARKAAAIPLTLGGSGILYTSLGCEEVAEMAHLLTSDVEILEQVVARQKERLQDFAPVHVEAKLREILALLDVPVAEGGVDR
jgi:glycosyltransferase involved in cell wall biosynthesis